MSRRAVRLLAVSVLLLAGGAQVSAETVAPTESVTVTGSRRAFHNFAKTFATPTMVTGKMARWEHRICPIVVGQNPGTVRYLTQRVQYVALAAGAPVNIDAPCSPNIEIVFTTTPQALLDNVRKNDPDYLGYATSSAQRDALATVTRTVQAWYATETTDIKGRHWPDTGKSIVNGNRVTNLIALPNGNGDILVNAPGQKLEDLPPFYASTGNHLNDGIHTGFNHILIVIDTTKLTGQEMVPLADYISLLALSQLNAPDACQDLPSVANRMARDCAQAADGLTMYDLAYLKGLYHMTTGRIMVAQWGEIGDLMTDSLAEAESK